MDHDECNSRERSKKKIKCIKWKIMHNSCILLAMTCCWTMGVGGKSIPRREATLVFEGASQKLLGNHDGFLGQTLAWSRKCNRVPVVGVGVQAYRRNTPGVLVESNITHSFPGPWCIQCISPGSTIKDGKSIPLPISKFLSNVQKIFFVLIYFKI